MANLICGVGFLIIPKNSLTLGGGIPRFYEQMETNSCLGPTVANNLHLGLKLSQVLPDEP